MIAVDTNILVYAHRPEADFHKKAYEVISTLISSNEAWAVPWPCLHEFIAVVTNKRIFKSPTPLKVAFDTVKSWLNVSFLGEGDTYLEQLELISIPTHLSGATIHDARIAAICKTHGIKELWSSDRDFSLFPSLKVRNPLV